MTGLMRLWLRGLFSVVCVCMITMMMGVSWSLGARRITRRIMQAAFRISAIVWGIRVRVHGAIDRTRPLIVVSNHFSYLDLFVLGSVLPLAFTPKKEIRSWPVLGLMCKVSGCLFIDRRAARTLENKDRLGRALAAGDVISLFPEGTTGDGTGLLPFKSSFFALAQEAHVPVQPVSIVYTKLNGRPVMPEDLPVIGWYGDAFFFPHLVRYLKQKNIESMLVFHPSVSASQFVSRKALALHCRGMIEKGMHGGSGRQSA